MTLFQAGLQEGQSQKLLKKVPITPRVLCNIWGQYTTFLLFTFLPPPRCVLICLSHGSFRSIAHGRDDVAATCPGVHEYERGTLDPEHDYCVVSTQQRH